MIGYGYSRYGIFWLRTGAFGAGAKNGWLAGSGFEGNQYPKHGFPCVALEMKRIG